VLRCDVFRVVQDTERHLTPATTEGAIVSGIALLLMVVLCVSETIAFLKPDIRTSMFVDHNERKKERVNFDVTFTKIKCHHMVVEIFDPQTGMPVPELTQTIHSRFQRVLAESPTVVVGDYDPSTGIISSSGEEGCRVSGTFHIDKVPGNFYLAGQRYMSPDRMPVSDHIINAFWIGDDRLDFKHDHIPESLANALGGVKHLHEDPPHTLYQYFLQIVPTYVVQGSGGKKTKAGYQYTATFSKAHAPDTLPPGVYFRHQHTPLAVEYRFDYQTWSHFLVHLCAVVGGVFTVMGFTVGLLEAGTKTVVPAIRKRLDQRKSQAAPSS
jgi:hypothetical protein